MKHVDLEKFANGAFSAQVNRAIEEVTENIQNPNTDAGATRKITVTIAFKPNAERNFVATQVLKGKTAYARGQKLVGTMPNNGAVKGVISNKDDSYVIAQGYHDGSGKVEIPVGEKEKLIPSNIREGINILGVDGQMSGSEGMKPQSKTITPSSAQQTILPDEGYNCLSQVVVEKIPYVESENSAGGITVTIG